MERLRTLALGGTVVVAVGLFAPRSAHAYGGYSSVGELVGLGVLGLLVPAVTEGTLTLIENDTVRGEPDGGWAAARYVAGSLYVAGGLALALTGDERTAAVGVGAVIGGGLMLVRGAAISIELASLGPPEQPTIRVLAGPGGVELRGRF